MKRALLFFVVLSTTNAFSQGTFLPGGRNGVVLSAGAHFADGTTGFRASTGYSFHGRLDLGLSYTSTSRSVTSILTAAPRNAPSAGRSVLRAPDIGTGYAEDIFSPGIRYHFLKIDPEHPHRSTDFSIGAAYLARLLPHYSYNGDPTRVVRSEYSADAALAWRIPLFGNQAAGASGSLYPSLGITVWRQSSRKDVEPLLNFGLHVIASTPGNVSFILAPRADFGDREFTYLLSAGILFTTSSH